MYLPNQFSLTIIAAGSKLAKLMSRPWGGQYHAGLCRVLWCVYCSVILKYNTVFFLFTYLHNHLWLIYSWHSFNILQFLLWPCAALMFETFIAWWILTVMYNFTQLCNLCKHSFWPHLSKFCTSFSVLLHNVWSTLLMCMAPPKRKQKTVSSVCTNSVKMTLANFRLLESLYMLQRNSSYTDVLLLSGRLWSLYSLVQVSELSTGYRLRR